MSVTRDYGQPSSCTISGKTNNQILREFSDGWLDRWTDRETDRQTDKQTGTQTERQTERQKGRQTERQPGSRQSDEIDFIGRYSTNVKHPTTKF